MVTILECLCVISTINELDRTFAPMWSVWKNVTKIDEVTHSLPQWHAHLLVYELIQKNSSFDYPQNERFTQAMFNNLELNKCALLFYLSGKESEKTGFSTLKFLNTTTTIDISTL